MTKGKFSSLEGNLALMFQLMLMFHIYLLETVYLVLEGSLESRKQALLET